MIRRFSEQTGREQENVRGGNGKVLFQDLFPAGEMSGLLSMASVVTLLPGCSIGVHDHTENGELYYILQGKAVVTQDGEDHVLTAGDAQFCAEGHTHGIRNEDFGPLLFLAVIVPEK